MPTRIDLLLTQKKQTTPRRLGDIGLGAPYVHLNCNKESAILPMPTNITSGNQILWEQKDFTADSLKGAIALDIYNKKGERSTAESVEAGWGQAKEALIKGGISNVASGTLGIEGAGDYYFHKKGLAVNPNKEMTFNGIGYRSFQLEFELIPLNSGEAKAIREFIEFFQTQAMPDFADPGISTYFAYPSSWDIKFGNADWLPKILPAYLTDYAINYGGVGKMVAHRDSSVQTNIQLTFVESQLHTRSKVKEGFIG